jgi:hypothetical protein
MAQKIKSTSSDDRAVNDRDRDTNPDPITGAPGSHPVGTGVGAAGGGVAGTLAGAGIGSIAGPVGSLVGGGIGAVAGAVGGGAVGKAVAEDIDPTVENEYWSKNYSTRPYYQSGMDYETDYLPAYQTGWQSASQYRGRTFDQAENDLRSDWERTNTRSRLSWDQAKGAVRDAWDRVSDRVDRAADSNPPTSSVERDRT